MPPPDPALFVKTIGGGMSDDGRTFTLQFDLANGMPVNISFPAVAAAAIFMGIQQQIGRLFEHQRTLLKGQDPRTFFPVGALKAEKIQGMFSHDGRPLVSVTLEGGLRLDFPVTREAILDLIAFLMELKEGSRTPPPPPH